MVQSTLYRVLRQRRLSPECLPCLDMTHEVRDGILFRRHGETSVIRRDASSLEQRTGMEAI